VVVGVRVVSIACLATAACYQSTPVSEQPCAVRCDPSTPCPGDLQCDDLGLCESIETDSLTGASADSNWAFMDIGMGTGSGTDSESGSGLTLELMTGAEGPIAATLTRSSTYDLTANAVQVGIAIDSSVVAGVGAKLAVQFDSTHFVAIEPNGTSVVYRVADDECPLMDTPMGCVDNGQPDVPYLGIRFGNTVTNGTVPMTTVFAETSSDGVTWSQHPMHSVSFAVTELEVALAIGVQTGIKTTATETATFKSLQLDQSHCVAASD
jgi:hypothetical protein